MLSRIWRLPGAISIALACDLSYLVFQNGGFEAGGWTSSILVLGLLAATYSLLIPSSEFAPPIDAKLRWPLFLLPAFVALQLVPLPLFLIRILAPARGRLWDSLVNVIPSRGFVSLSVSPSTTVSYLLKVFAYIMVFLLVREIAWRTRREWPWLLLAPLIIIAAAEAALGQSQSAQGVAVQGTYANKNHFAGLLEMILPGTVAFGIAMTKGDEFFPPSLFRTLTSALLFVTGTAIFVAILESQSKMGFVATLCGLFTVGVLTLRSGRQARGKWFALAALAVVLLGAFVFFPSDQVIQGFGSSFLDDSTGEGRLPVAADTIRLIADYPLFGTGLGTYGSAFVKYQTTGVDVAWFYAHNDYLQLLAELGIPGFLLLAFGTAMVFIWAVRASLIEDPNTRFLALGCAGGMVAIGLHSFTDFNLYLPANAIVLVWISGIVAGLAVSPQDAGVFPGRSYLKPIVLALSCVLVVFGTGWLIFEGKYRGDHVAEGWFCRFGICDIDSVLAAESTVRAGNFATARPATLLEAVRRDPANPERWADLGESMHNSGQNTQAALCYSNAISLGPNDPPLLMRAADFYQSTGEGSRALQLISHALAPTQIYIAPIFSWLASNNIPAEEVLARVLPQEPSLYMAYLRDRKNADDASGAEQLWSASLKHGYLDDPMAREFVNWLYGKKEYQAAATAWGAYLGERSRGYSKSNWIFNGDFESEITPVALDWSINPSDATEVDRDADTKHSGKYSLRIKLAGKQNLTGIPVSQRAVVTPGRYHFEAYVKTENLTTDQGISVQVSYTDRGTPLTLTREPLLGTSDWRQLRADFCVTPQTKLVGLSFSRQPSLKFDSMIKGTLWIDSVILSKLSPTCAT